MGYEELKLGASVVGSYLGAEIPNDDDIEHHGVKGQKWGDKNGPPYPLSRQKKFSPDGGPVNPSRYKKIQKQQRAQKRAERKANPNGTPEDRKEKFSISAQIKRVRRQQEAERKQANEEKARQLAAREKAKDQIKAEEAEYDKAISRLEGLDIPDKDKDAIWESVNHQVRGHGIPGQSWGPRLGEMKKKADDLNEAIDKYYEKQASDRENAKLHGTAEEVMKFRESFTTEEWNDISRRLEAEERVKKFLDRSVNSNRNDSNQGNQNGPQIREAASSEKELMKGLDSNAKKIFLEGDARTVFNNRTKFNTQQLRHIEERLKAEDSIGQYANKQVNLDSDRLQKLQKAVKYLNEVGKGAESIGKILALVDPSFAKNKDKGGGNKGGSPFFVFTNNSFGGNKQQKQDNKQNNKQQDQQKQQNDQKPKDDKKKQNKNKK